MAAELQHACATHTSNVQEPMQAQEAITSIANNESGPGDDLVSGDDDDSSAADGHDVGDRDEQGGNQFERTLETGEHADVVVEPARQNKGAQLAAKKRQLRVGQGTVLGSSSVSSYLSQRFKSVRKKLAETKQRVPGYSALILSKSPAENVQVYSTDDRAWGDAWNTPSIHDVLAQKAAGNNPVAGPSVREAITIINRIPSVSMQDMAALSGSVNSLINRSLPQ